MFFVFILFYLGFWTNNILEQMYIFIKLTEVQTKDNN